MRGHRQPRGLEESMDQSSRIRSFAALAFALALCACNGGSDQNLEKEARGTASGSCNASNCAAPNFICIGSSCVAASSCDGCRDVNNDCQPGNTTALCGRKVN